jgi:sugar phosphate permease
MGKPIMQPVGAETQGPVPAAGQYRWIICALLFFAATVDYIGRQVIGLLKPTLRRDLGWNEIDYSNIVFAFQRAYAIGLIIAGRVMDWLGTRKGFSAAVFLRSLAVAAHQGWSANIFTVASDMFPKRAIGPVVGFGGMAGAVGGMLIAKLVGYILPWTGSYMTGFLIAGPAYRAALGIMHLLAPRLEPARLGEGL